MLVTPLCVLTAIGIGIYEHRLVTTLLTLLWIAAVPLGALGFSSWLGVWFPYHVLPLRYRWARRRRWRRMLARWLALVLAPYAVVPLLTAVLTLPSVLLWAAVAPAGKADRITDEQFAWGLLLAAVLAVAAWTVGHWYGPRLAHRRRDGLTEFLRDPERG
jgi:polyferredoxin